MTANLIRIYICKHVLSGVILIAVISAMLFLTVSIILWSPGMIANGWNEYDVFLKVSYATPWFLCAIYPAIIAVGTLMAFTFLSQNNEIVVLRAVGFSKIDFIKIILVPAIILALFGFFLTSFLSPMSYSLGEKIAVKHVAFHSAWLKEKNNIVYVKKIGDKKLYDIDIFNLTNLGVKKIYIVKDATTGSASELYSVLIKNYKNNAVTQKYMPELAWRNLFPDKNILNELSISQRGLNIFQLNQLIKMQKKMGLSFKNDQFRFWRMILLPFFSLILMFTMIPFAFHEQRSKSLVNNAVLGLVISIIFYYCNQIAWSLVVILNLPIFLGALIAPTFIFIFCLVYLRL